MIATIVKFIGYIIDLLKWWNRPSKKISDVENKAKERMDHNAKLVSGGTDEEMVDRISNL